MRVLINGFDLFRSVGGGQTYYRGVIGRNPRIDFYYLRAAEPADAPRPPNAHGLPYRDAYGIGDLSEYADPGPPGWATYDYLHASNIAASAAGLGFGFDVVDTPDYYGSSAFVAPALRRHGVAVGRVALSMHGAISTTHALNWGADGRLPAGRVRCEQLQYAAADVRYFISPTYRDEWRAMSALPSHFLDPMWCFDPPARLPYRDTGGPPGLHFVGRTERRKGPHYFLQMLWWLPRHSYREASIIGPDSFDQNGVASSDHLRAMIRRRRLDGAARLVPAMAPGELAELFASRSVVVAPSQYDTLNLVALESLFAGCPTVVGSGAGVCRYLRERFPDVPFVELDVERFYAGLPAVEALLAGYDDRRAELEAAVAAADLSPRGPGLAAIYAAEPAFEADARATCAEWDDRFSRGVASSRRSHAA